MSQHKYPSDQQARFLVRLPDGMRDRIAEEAKAANRSMNSHIVHILQNHFDRFDDEMADRAAGLEEEESTGLSVGLKEPADRAAALKVLRFPELMLLRRRVTSLGGRKAVLEATRAELMERLEKPDLEGTDAERRTYYSKRIGDMPLTTVLTTDEIERLAMRVVGIQNEQER